MLPLERPYDTVPLLTFRVVRNRRGRITVRVLLVGMHTGHRRSSSDPEKLATLRFGPKGSPRRPDIPGRLVSKDCPGIDATRPRKYGLRSPRYSPLAYERIYPGMPTLHIEVSTVPVGTHGYVFEEYGAGLPLPPAEGAREVRGLAPLFA